MARDEPEVEIGVGVGAGQGVVARWRTLPDFLAATLQFGRRQDCAAGPDRAVPLAVAPRALDGGSPGTSAEATLLAPVATAHAASATPEARARGIPQVRLVRARCVLRRGERRCAAICPPGAVVIGGGADGAPPAAEVAESGPAGADAWAIDVHPPGDGEPVRLAVWAMCI